LRGVAILSVSSRKDDDLESAALEAGVTMSVAADTPIEKLIELACDLAQHNASS
jgi:hypothetical protein